MVLSRHAGSAAVPVDGGNLLPKLLCRPGYLGIVLIATLLTFF
ncbi:hypothetical protein [Allorhizocola rhizosphaerae]|nr:hypothetical protein [Allorhizocola rhizosphaerae]